MAGHKNGAGAPGKSIAELTREYIESRPSIKDCLAAGLMNYTELARRIMKELDLKNEEAITVACRRYEMELEKKEHQEELVGLLEQSHLELKNKVGVVIARNTPDVIRRLDDLLPRLLGEKSLMQTIVGSQTVTVITEEKRVADVVATVGKEDIVRQTVDLAQLAVRSPEKVEEVSGVVAYLSGALAERGVNIVEAYSCFTDTIFLVREKDVMHAYAILSAIVQA
ncbi:MAG TPA: ACT domain-containing protein [Thermoplasmata archaeon]|nr:ACT domain-containing protein [Thermoplasmata archaeon]